MAFHVVVAQGTGDFIPFQVRLKIAIDYRSWMSHLQINPSAALVRSQYKSMFVRLPVHLEDCRWHSCPKKKAEE